MSTRRDGKQTESDDPAFVKISASLPRKTYLALQELAGSRGITMTEALRQAIEMERFLATKKKIIVEDKDDKLVQLVRP